MEFSLNHPDNSNMNQISYKNSIKIAAFSHQHKTDINVVVVVAVKSAGPLIGTK